MGMKIVYFLGYSRKKTKLINFLEKKKNIKLVHFHNRELSLKNINKADLIISFGYRKIIKKQILKKVNRKIINLHISYLPYNRGSHPNFWSFFDKTLKGVTIHEVNEKIDKGNIIFREKVIFKNIKDLTFKKTYLFLFNKIEKLFIKNFKKILYFNYKSFKPKGKGSIHKKNDLPESMKNWDVNINKYLKNEKNF